MNTLRIVTTIVSAIALATPACAEEWYLGLGLAPGWLHTEFKHDDGFHFSPDIDTSFMVSGAIGVKSSNCWWAWATDSLPLTKPAFCIAM